VLFRSIKDHATLLDASARLAARHAGTPFRLHLIGDGPLRAELEARADAAGLADRVRFLGNRDDVAEQLGQLDGFVLSTTAAEGFGIVLIEALAAGVPVVASDVPACREVLRDGRLGTLVPPGDAGALARALEPYITGAPAASAPPLAEVEAAYGLQAMADGYLRVLDLAEPAR